MGDHNGRPEDQSVHSVAHRDSDEWRRAETFRKTEIFGRSALTFKKIWDETDDPEAGWRYAHCLRRTGYQEVALGLLRELANTQPDNEQVKEELLWALYEGRLLPAKAEQKSSDLLSAAKEMVALGAEDRLLKLAVFAVMGNAKTKGQWSNVSNWCDLLDPRTLSSASRGGNKGQAIPSDRERWYFAKLKALVKLEEWHYALEIALEGCRDFPDNRDFVRWQASARAGLGQTETAIALLEGLRPRIPWYALADIAQYHLRLENIEEAWKTATQAARAQGQDSAKVNLWGLMAKLCLTLDRPESSLNHLGLMIALREEREWPLRPSHLEQLRQTLASNSLSKLPQKSPRDWKRLAQDDWGGPDGSHHKSENRNRPKRQRGTPPTFGKNTGRVIGWENGRSFAFIRPSGGGEPIFVLSRDLPEAAQGNGTEVSFTEILHFNKKKNRESLRAVNVRLTEAIAPEEDPTPA